MLFHIKINQSLQSCQVNSAIKWRNSSYIRYFTLSFFFFPFGKGGYFACIVVDVFFSGENETQNSRCLLSKKVWLLSNHFYLC